METFVIQILANLPALIKAGEDVTALIQSGHAVLSEKRNPTAEEWSALNAKIAALRGELHAPGT